MWSIVKKKRKKIWWRRVTCRQKMRVTSLADGSSVVLESCLINWHVNPKDLQRLKNTTYTSIYWLKVVQSSCLWLMLYFLDSINKTRPFSLQSLEREKRAVKKMCVARTICEPFGRGKACCKLPQFRCHDFRSTFLYKEKNGGTRVYTLLFSVNLKTSLYFDLMML